MYWQSLLGVYSSSPSIVAEPVSCWPPLEYRLLTTLSTSAGPSYAVRASGRLLDAGEEQQPEMPVASMESLPDMVESYVDIMESGLYSGIIETKESLMSNSDWNDTDRRNSKAYLREFLPAIVGYVVTLGAAIAVVNLDTAGWWRYLAVLLPVLPVLWGIRAVARHLARIDEYGRSVQLEGMAFGFGASMAASVTIGFLSIGGLDTAIWGPWVIYVTGMLGWIVHTGRRLADGSK